MGVLADEAFAPASLQRAWADVLARDLADGVPGIGVAAWVEEAEANLAGLASALASGQFRARTLTSVEVAKPAGGIRLLHVPAVSDRVVARSILRVITPLVDPHLGHAAFAYRPGLGVGDAVEAVVAFREEGLRWVLRTDIDDCFPTVPVDRVRRRLGVLVDDPHLLVVVDRLLARRARGSDGRSRRVAGLAQGCALSPLLSNLALLDLDDALADRGFQVVRYADDVVVAARTRDMAWEAARCASSVLEGMGMALGADKTQVMSFDEGFTFVGEDFGPRYPPALGRVEEPDRKVVYAAAQASGIRIARGRLLIESTDDVELLNVPVTQVQRLVLFGSVGLSAGARAWAMANDVDVVFASRRGTFQGSLTPASKGARVSRVRRQIAVAGTPAALAIAKAIIEAKILKQVTLLRRLTDVDIAEDITHAVSTMESMARLVPGCSDTDEVMGLEGAAAAAYFPAFGLLMPEELRFRVRTRQPPRDLANSALSFLYTVLLGECITALSAAGLDPAFGLLHADQDRRPSLALDLQEEFRPLIVDQVVAEAARQHRLRPEHSRTDDGAEGVMLTKAGRQALLEGYERRMLQHTRGALPEYAGSWRRHLYRQAQRLSASIMTPAQAWTGLSWRP